MSLWGEAMFDKIRKMIKENGHFSYDGNEYVLIEQAFYTVDERHYDDPCYSARAFRLNTLTDEATARCYTVKWDIIDPDEDESNICDWSSPSEVIENGFIYDVDQDRII